jgi:hypothetical protein
VPQASNTIARHVDVTASLNLACGCVLLFVSVSAAGPAPKLTVARIMQVSWHREQFGARIGKAEPTSGLGSGTVIMVTRNCQCYDGDDGDDGDDGGTSECLERSLTVNEIDGCEQRRGVLEYGTME